MNGAIDTRPILSAIKAPTLVMNRTGDPCGGSGIDFTDMGSHALKGVPGEWRLFAARS